MGGVSESKVRLVVRRTRVRDSRSTPNRPQPFGEADESALDLHWEIDSFSRKAMGWSCGLCIQLASIDFGAVAQLGERLICIQEVAGSIPTSSTSAESLGL